MSASCSPSCAACRPRDFQPSFESTFSYGEVVDDIFAGLGVPVLAGSAAYAVAEALAWRAGMNERPRMARKFYAVVAVAITLTRWLCPAV